VVCKHEFKIKSVIPSTDLANNVDDENKKATQKRNVPVYASFPGSAVWLFRQSAPVVIPSFSAAPLPARRLQKRFIFMEDRMKRGGSVN
jgi:hypothetical protein